MRQLSLAAVLVVVTATPHLWAEETPRSDKAAAEALFAEGRKLMLEGRYAEACPKFEASQRIDPGIGTMLNLAECYEKTGRTASAWAEFREVISAARAADSKQRKELARQRAQALEGRLSRLTIRLAPANAAIPGLEIRRDGAIVDPAEVGSAIPVDPGEHVVEATAPGKQKWLQSVEVDGNGSAVSIDVPPLADARDASSSAGTASSAATAEVSADGGRSSGSKVLPIAIGAVGLVGVGVGTFFGLRASSAWSDAKKECDDYPYECSARGQSLEEDARGHATLSTVGFIAGGVGLAASAILWFTSGSSSTESAEVGLGPGNVVVRGRF